MDGICIKLTGRETFTITSYNEFMIHVQPISIETHIFDFAKVLNREEERKKLTLNQSLVNAALFV